MPANVRPEFGAAVRQVLLEHGASLRSQRVRTGVGHMTVKDMTDGIVPTLEKLEAFARGFGLDENELRELAGYPRADTRCQAALSGVETLIGGLLALQDEFGRPVPIPRACGHVRTLTTDEAEDILSVIRRELKENRY